MVQWAGLQLGTRTFPMEVTAFSASDANISGKATDYGPNTCVTTILLGDSNGVPGLLLWPSLSCCAE